MDDDDGEWKAGLEIEREDEPKEMHEMTESDWVNANRQLQEASLAVLIEVADLYFTSNLRESTLASLYQHEPLLRAVHNLYGNPESPYHQRTHRTVQ